MAIFHCFYEKLDGYETAETKKKKRNKLTTNERTNETPNQQQKNDNKARANTKHMRDKSVVFYLKAKVSVNVCVIAQQ